MCKPRLGRVATRISSYSWAPGSKPVEMEDGWLKLLALQAEWRYQMHRKTPRTLRRITGARERRAGEKRSMSMHEKRGKRGLGFTGRSVFCFIIIIFILPRGSPGQVELKQLRKLGQLRLRCEQNVDKGFGCLHALPGQLQHALMHETAENLKQLGL